MTGMRLSAAVPGSGIRRTLRNARIAGSDAIVDVVLEDATVAAITPAGAQEPEVEFRDLDGRWLLPGLRDNHVHFTQWAQTARRLDLSGARTDVEAAALVEARTRETAGEDAPLIGFGFRDALWPDAPSRQVLDRASRGRSVIVIAGDLHCVWLNSAALAEFGHADHPTGLLREEEAFAVHRSLGSVDERTLDGWVAEAALAASARGVTGIVDFEMAWNLESWQRRITGGNLALRVSFGIYPQHLERALAERLTTGQTIAHTHGLLRVGSLKVITDGSLNTRTAYCVDPYPGISGPDAHGALTVPTDELIALMTRARSAGLDSAIHAIGDRANALVFDAFEASGASGTIEHAQLLTREDVGRFGELPVTASVQPEHAMDDRDVAEHYWAGRTDRAFMLRSILDAGGRIALGSDAPVAPLDPWVAISAAAFRSRDGREAWHPEQSITVAEALSASTATGRADVRAGDRADLTAVDLDPYAASTSELRRMPVAATILNGRFTHDRL